MKNKAFLSFSFLLCFVFSYGQEKRIDSLKTSVTDLEDVLIVAGNLGDNKRALVFQTLYISKDEIKTLNAQSTADLLGNSGLIHVQKSQMGGGSITLRGFEASRNVLVIDGIRMNNLIYRSGHLQNIITTDNSVFDHIEVVFGPASTLFGSDALGGVVAMYTKNPEFSKTEKTNFKVNYFGRYGTVNSEFTNHVDVNLGKKRIASLSSFTYSNFGDLMCGKSKNPFYKSSFGERNYYAIRSNDNLSDSVVKNSNRYLQVGSGYSQFDILQNLSFKQNGRIQHQLNIQVSNSSTIDRYDRLSEIDSSANSLRFAEWYYGPQFRFLSAYNLKVIQPFKRIDFMDLKLNYQAIEESRITRRFGSAFRDSRIENVGVLGGTLQFTKTNSKHAIQFGLDAQYNTLSSTAERKNILLDTTSNWETRYPKGANNVTTFAFFLSEKWNITDKLTVVDGFRLGYNSLRSTIADFSFYPVPFSEIKQNNLVYSGSVGVLINPSEKCKFSVNLSTGFRTPNVDDLAKIFESNPDKKQVIVPNEKLKPEQTITFDLGYTQFVNKNLTWENVVYYTDFTNALSLGIANFNGSDSILYDGVMSKVYSPQNNKNAFVYGFSSTLKAKIQTYLSISAGISYTYGRIKTDSTNLPLDHIPPFLANFSFNFKKDKFSCNFFTNLNGWKRLKDYNIEGEDNFQYATAVGMPAWFTLNFRASYQLHKWFNLQAGVDNLFDTQYRTFASGINGGGRNIFMRLNFQL